MHKFNPANLERLLSDERALWFPPEPVLDAVVSSPDLTVLDFGAGPGYHSIGLAERVGPAGLVIATDVEPAMLHRLKETADHLQLTNIGVLLTDERGIPLRDRAVNCVLLSLVVHEVRNRHHLFSDIYRALDVGGRIVIVEWLPRHTAHGPDPSQRLAPQQLVEELRLVGFISNSETGLGVDCYILSALKGRS